MATPEWTKGGYSAYDAEAAQPFVPAQGYASFADQLVRKGFVRKVFGEWPPAGLAALPLAVTTRNWA